MRGKPQHLLTEQLENGLIPAHTGKTASSKSHRPRTRAHPHSCGENVTLLPQQSAQPGSSPLTRGKLIDPLIALAVGGLIPAHAGKTSPFRLRVVAVGAHPRSRGENYRDGNDLQLPEGSSPLTRGKRFLVNLEDVLHGLIPAHAGKTQPRGWLPRRARAHPRSRGENASAPSRRLYGVGSSPLTRGKPGRSCPSTRAAGLIPAHAGKTVPGWLNRGARRAHPRSRGENPFRIC